MTAKAKEAPNPRHLKKSIEWFTPPEIVEAAREVMHGIDLDPMSCSEANRTVKVTKFYSRRQDGLAPWNKWEGKLLVNPPGGLVKPCWQRLVMAYEGRVPTQGVVTQAVWVGFSVEQLQTLQVRWAGATPLSYPVCYLRRRLRFGMPKATRIAREAEGLPAGDRPSHANYIVYLPPFSWDHAYAINRKVDAEAVALFVDIFGKFGQVVIP